jgi:GT2 family glycosyltransferase
MALPRTEDQVTVIKGPPLSQSKNSGTNAVGNSIRVTISVPTYMRERFIVGNVRSILSNTYDNFELIVVDQSPSRLTESLLSRKFDSESRLRYIHTDSVGQSRARNIALGEAQGELILYTDDDVVVIEDWVKAYVDCYRYLQAQGITPGIMGGPIKGIWEAPKPDWWPQEFLYCLNEFDLSGGRQKYSGGHFPSTTNFACSTSLLRTVGGFDERIGYFGAKRGLGAVGGEDTRVVLQLQHRGYEPYFEPRAVVRHIMVKERLTRKFFYRRLFAAGVDSATMTLAFEGKRPMASSHLIVRSFRQLVRSLLRLALRRGVSYRSLTAQNLMEEWGYALKSLGSLFGTWIWFTRFKR